MGIDGRGTKAPLWPFSTYPARLFRQIVLGRLSQFPPNPVNFCKVML